MKTENEIKGILVTFFRDGTKGDYLDALNEAISQLIALTEANKITSNTVLADSAFFTTSSTTKMKEGYYTDNFNTYYIDSEGKKHLR